MTGELIAPTPVEVEGRSQVARSKWRPYPEYKDSGVKWLGELPEHWNTLRLKRACTLITDGSHFSPKSQFSGLPYITVRDLLRDSIDIEKASKISEDDFKILERNGCKPHIGDILLSKDGVVYRN